MQSEWFVSSNPIPGPEKRIMMYQAQRRKDTSAVDYSGNRDDAGGFYEDKDKAQEIVDKLNAEEKERGEALTAQEAQAIADKLNAEEHHKKAQEEAKPMAEQEEKQAGEGDPGKKAAGKEDDKRAGQRGKQSL